MKTKRAPTIRSKLIMLVLACVVPASLMAVLFIAHDYQRAREHLLFNLLTTARTMMSVVDRDIASIESSLAALATSPNLDDRNFRAFYTQAQRIQNDSENISIALLDASGSQVLNTRYPFDEMLADYSLADGFQTIQDTGKPLISNIFTSQANPRPLIAIGVPIHVSGQTTSRAMRYTLHAAISPERFEKLLQHQGLPAEWISAVFDGAGTIIARNRETSRFVGRKGSPDLLEHLAAGDTTFVSTTHDGVTVHTVISRSKVSNWSLGIGIPTKIINDQLRFSLL